MTVFSSMFSFVVGLIAINYDISNGAPLKTSITLTSAENVDELGTGNSSQIAIQIDLNSCIDAMTKKTCIESCGSFLSVPPVSISSFSTVSFEVLTALWLNQTSTYCQSHFFLLDGSCTYSYNDINDNNNTYTLDLTWFYETTGNSGFDLIVTGPTFNSSIDPEVHVLSYKDLTSEEELVCWWIYYNSTDTPTSCAGETNDANCSPQVAAQVAMVQEKESQAEEIAQPVHIIGGEEEEQDQGQVQ